MQDHHRNSNHKARFRRHQGFRNTACQNAGVVCSHFGNHSEKRNDTCHRTEQAKQRSNRSHGSQQTHAAFQFRLFAEHRFLQRAFCIFAFVAGTIQHSKQHQRKTRFLFQAKVRSIFVTGLLHKRIQLFQEATAQMSAEREHQEAFQAKEQGKDCHQGQGVHHNATLLKESLQFFVPGQFLSVGDRILDSLILQNIQRNRHSIRSSFRLSHRLFDAAHHIRRKRRIPFKHLSLQSPRTEQCLHVTVIQSHFSKENCSQAQAIHVYVGARAHLRYFTTKRLRVGQFMAQQQVVHKALHRSDCIRNLLVRLTSSLT